MPRKNAKEVELSHSSVITKSNDFSMAKLNGRLSLNQTQLLMYAILSTQNEGDLINSTFIKADFERQFGLESYPTQKAKADVAKIMSLSFSTEDIENDKFEYYNIFQYIKYNKGKFVFEWTNYMIPHILDLKDRYVTTDLQLASQFASSFSWTLYDYLKANYGMWYKRISKDAILRLFGVENNKSYVKNTSLFKKFVLDIAIEEINRLTELEVSYEDEKKGRAISGFLLKWSIGNTKRECSPAQREQIHVYIDTVFKDLLKYMSLKDSDRLLKARGLILKLEDYKKYDDPTIKITSAKASQYIMEIGSIFNQLENLIERDGKGIAEFYDWTKEKGD